MLLTFQTIHSSVLIRCIMKKRTEKKFYFVSEEGRRKKKEVNLDSTSYYVHIMLLHLLDKIWKMGLLKSRLVNFNNMSTYRCLFNWIDLCFFGGRGVRKRVQINWDKERNIPKATFSQDSKSSFVVQIGESQ